MRRLFSLMTYVDKKSHFEDAPPGHTIAHKTTDDLLKDDRHMS